MDFPFGKVYSKEKRAYFCKVLPFLFIWVAFGIGREKEEENEGFFIF